MHCPSLWPPVIYGHDGSRCVGKVRFFLLVSVGLSPIDPKYLNKMSCSLVTKSAWCFSTLSIDPRVYKPEKEVMKIMASHISQDVLIQSRQAGRWVYELVRVLTRRRTSARGGELQVKSAD